MSIKKIREKNSQQLIDDLKKVTECLAYTTTTNSLFTVKKTQVKNIAQNKEISYFLTKDVYVIGRLVMVIC